MACPDRNNDQRILAEIERRKAVRQVPSIPEESTIIEISGELQEVLLADIPEQDILKIQKSPNGWQVYVKNMKS